MKKKETQVEASVIREVLGEIARERREVHDDLRYAQEALQDLVASINRDNQAIVTALNEAEADLQAHKRYEGKVSQQDYDSRRRVLERARDDARADHEAASKDAQKRVSPKQERLRALNERAQRLLHEWQSQERLARAAGVDLRAYWTPENPVADEDPEPVVVEQ